MILREIEKGYKVLLELKGRGGESRLRITHRNKLHTVEWWFWGTMLDLPECDKLNDLLCHRVTDWIIGYLDGDSYDRDEEQPLYGMTGILYDLSLEQAEAIYSALETHYGSRMNHIGRAVIRSPTSI